MKTCQELEQIEESLLRFDFDHGDWAELRRLMARRGQLVAAGFGDQESLNRGRDFELRLGDYREEVSRSLYRVNQFAVIQQDSTWYATGLDTSG